MKIDPTTGLEAATGSERGRRRSRSGPWTALAFALAVCCCPPALAQSDAEDRELALRLSALLQAARGVISENQSLINNPRLGDKGLTGAVVLKRALDIYHRDRPEGSEPTNARADRLLKAEKDAIVEVLDRNQGTINAHEMEFKGFIPALFGRLLSETFTRNAAGEARIKVTAPMELVRNRRVRPESWEDAVIREKFSSPSWPRGAPYFETIRTDGKTEFRMLQPEYYASSCLSCHGTPKGSIDMTGHPREGAHEHDLGSIISVRLNR